MYKNLYFISAIIVFIMIAQLNAFGLSSSQESFSSSSNDVSTQSVFKAPTSSASSNDIYYPYTGIDDPHPIKENTKIYNAVDSYPGINAYGFYPTTSTSFVITIKSSDSVKIQISDIDGSTLYEFCTEGNLENNFFINLPSKYFYPINIIGCSNNVEYSFKIVPDSQRIIEITEGDFYEGSLTDNQSIYYYFVPGLSGAYALDIFESFKYNIVVLKDKKEEIKNFFGYYILEKDTEYYIRLSNTSEYNYSNYYFSIKFVEEDFGNTMSSATEIKTNEAVIGSLFIDQDIDYYYFVPEISGVYRLNLLNRLDTIILNNFNEEIESSDGYYLLKGNERYFVKITKRDETVSQLDYIFSIDGAIDDYENEKEYASKVSVGSNIHGNLTYFQDVDSFYFIPEKTGTYDLIFSSNIPDSLITKAVFEENNNPISKLSGYYVFEENQKYYIQICEPGDFEIPVDYEFTILGPIEEDNGDNPNYATVVEVGNRVKGSFIHDQDIDYYYFTPKTTGAYKLDISSNESTNSFNSHILYNNYEEVETINGYYILEENEKYYIEFRNYAILNSLINYEFSINGPYAEDNGNDISKAVKIETGIAVTGSLIFDRDIDYYCLIPKKSGAYKLNILGEDIDPKHYNLTILDDSENPIENLSDYFNLTENKKYYIKLWNGDSKEFLSNYNFSITGPLEEDYGDTISTSKSVYMNQDIQGSIYSYEDCDVFSFTAPSIACVINVDGVPVEAISLYDSSNKLVNHYIGYCAITEFENPVINETKMHPLATIYYDNLHIGDTYFLKIGGDTNPVDYNFKIKPLNDDYGNSLTSAKTINIATPVTGKINYSHDEDIFKFMPESSDIYCISFLGDSSLEVNVMDPTTDQFLISPYNSDLSGDNYVLEKGKTYYISVSAVNDTDYTFTINKPTPEVKTGDINGDDNINAIDFANLRMYLLGMIDKFPSPSGKDAADINHDGEINAIDFALLRQYLLGMIYNI